MRRFSTLFLATVFALSVAVMPLAADESHHSCASHDKTCCAAGAACSDATNAKCCKSDDGDCEHAKCCGPDAKTCKMKPAEGSGCAAGKCCKEKPAVPEQTR
jgi:hypothetical protein